MKAATIEPFPGWALGAIAAGRPSAADFSALVEHHQSRVYSIAFRIVGDRGAAEEVAQDVFLALSRNLDRIENPEHLLAWLRRVAVQRATDACRRRSSRVDFSAAEYDEESNPAVAELDGTSSLHLATWAEKLVGILPHPQRAIVLLRYQEDMTPAEIADALNMPIATVKSYLQRALKKMRAKAELLRRI
ncbi:MAG TPA: sigma-70 family RNA polymerase sigma factor [Acidobacteriaceae bacterium]|nr:sigma-70 family RNA polymerase sigma factor [Acidobacteriaceae bacterium]